MCFDLEHLAKKTRKTAASALDIQPATVPWCNGITAVFDKVSLGSNPSGTTTDFSPTKNSFRILGFFWLADIAT